MTAAAIITLIVGFNVAAPLTAMGAVSFLGTASQTGQIIVKAQQIFDTPQAREWAAINGEAAIRMRPGISTER